MSLPDPTNPLSAPSEITSSAADNSETASLAPPQGWSDDPTRMFLDYYWQGRDEDLKESLETDYRIPDPQPLLARDSRSGDVMFLLQSRHKGDSEIRYYVWNDIESALSLIKSPTNLKEIYKTIDESEGYLRGLEFEVVSGKACAAAEEE